MSPLLFNLVVDVFTRMLSKAVGKVHTTEFLNSIYPEGIISLQYADDTLLFMQHGYRYDSQLKWPMTCFEKLSEMKINFNKNDLIPVNLDEEESQSYAHIFLLQIGGFFF
jgi:hypothetical protein